MKVRISGDGWHEEVQLQRATTGNKWSAGMADGTRVDLDLQRLEEGLYRFSFNHQTHTLTLLPGNEAGRPLRFLVDDQYVELTVQDEFDLLESLLGSSRAARETEELRSVMPGLVRSILVTPGAVVEKHQPLLILEAMKMENEVRAPMAGVVERVVVKEQRAVGAGELLLVLRPRTEQH